MKERPILFSAPMVRAILGGTKTQTRRVVTPQPKENPGLNCRRLIFFRRNGRVAGNVADVSSEIFSPYGIVGDRLWVRETYVPLKGSGEVVTPAEASYVLFRDGSQKFREGDYYYQEKPRPYVASAWDRVRGKWRPSIHMPRWASRISLEVAAVRVEPLQEITPEDAIAEGLSKLTKDDGRTWKYGIVDRDGLPGSDDEGWQWQSWSTDLVEAYSVLWDSINAARGFSWESNPWVWRIAFRRVEQASEAKVSA